MVRHFLERDCDDNLNDDAFGAPRVRCRDARGGSTRVDVVRDARWCRDDDEDGDDYYDGDEDERLSHLYRRTTDGGEDA